MKETASKIAICTDNRNLETLIRMIFTVLSSLLTSGANMEPDPIRPPSSIVPTPVHSSILDTSVVVELLHIAAMCSGLLFFGKAVSDFNIRRKGGADQSIKLSLQTGGHLAARDPSPIGDRGAELSDKGSELSYQGG